MKKNYDKLLSFYYVSNTISNITFCVYSLMMVVSSKVHLDDYGKFVLLWFAYGALSTIYVSSWTQMIVDVEVDEGLIKLRDRNDYVSEVNVEDVLEIKKTDTHYIIRMKDKKEIKLRRKILRRMIEGTLEGIFEYENENTVLK